MQRYEPGVKLGVFSTLVAFMKLLSEKLRFSLANADNLPRSKGEGSAFSSLKM